MTLAQLKSLLAAHGPVMDDWPLRLQPAATALIERSSTAQDLFIAAVVDEPEPQAPAQMYDSEMIQH